MNISVINYLLKKSEGADLDFKEMMDMSSGDKINKEKLLKRISAIANSVESTGWLLFGVENDTKKIVGCTVLEEEKIQQICSQYIHPPVDITVENISYQSKNLGLITITSSKKPYEIIKTTGGLTKGNVYIRRGSVTEKATPIEIHELFKSREEDTSPLLEWVESEAKQVVIEKVQAYTYSDNSSLDHVTETDFKSFVLPYSSGKKGYIAITCSHGEGCHAASAVFGIFEFTEASDEWRLISEDCEAFYAGAWGEPPSDYKVIEIGKDKFGIIVIDGYGNQGIFHQDLSIYTKIGSSYRCVFHEILAYDESGRGSDFLESWSSTIKFDKQGHSFYDITLTKKGCFPVDNGEPENKKYQNSEIEVVYKFDGNEYSKTDFII